MEHPLTDNWFVLRDLTRPNAKRPAYRLLEEKGIEIFTPMRWRLVERKGKRIREEVPLLHDLLFAHTTRTCMDSIVEEISTLQYRYLRGGYRKPMTVGHAEMNRFIRAVHSDDSPRYFLVEELTPAMYGRMIRIEGGPLDGYEGRLLSIRGSRVKRLIVEIPGLLVAAVEVDPVYIRLLLCLSQCVFWLVAYWLSLSPRLIFAGKNRSPLDGRGENMLCQWYDLHFRISHPVLHQPFIRP